MTRKFTGDQILIATHNAGKLEEIAGKCPVHRTLEATSVVTTKIIE